ncbi:hypothetical protein IW261DRAFT_1416970 [Armillaria novae-zelandiae]|uniref:Uncharacterized protein n=1 Tax=Armillaria novae-zelandiae TaxID=153914 RepID=A0AA39PIV8_9AGAR|nr:hypothetical protein IW261DRAFT_1416970 [Armillaria novae-zelandiae]
MASSEISDVLQGVQVLLHGRHNHGNILKRLVSLDADKLFTKYGIRFDEELVMARDIVCGILPGPSILSLKLRWGKSTVVPALRTLEMIGFSATALDHVEDERAAASRVGHALPSRYRTSEDRTMFIGAIVPYVAGEATEVMPFLIFPIRSVNFHDIRVFAHVDDGRRGITDERAE